MIKGVKQGSIKSGFKSDSRYCSIKSRTDNTDVLAQARKAEQTAIANRKKRKKRK